MESVPDSDGPQRDAPPPGDGAPVTATDAGASRVTADDGRCAVELPQFEGPLDLLLHLVRRHELDILDIPISFVCEKYLEYLDVMQALDLETAGEYLVMAATLAYLKSRELVPSDPLPGEDGTGAAETSVDPRAELIARLLEYQRYRAAAAELDRMPVSGRDVFDRGGKVDVAPLDQGLAPITLYRLAEAYQRVLERARVLRSHEVVIERVSVSTRMKQLTSVLLERSRFEFEQLFLDRSWDSEHELRAMLIVTLMSVLELVRLGIARVHQPEGSDTLLVERAATAEEAERALSGYDEHASFGAPAQPSAPEPALEDDPADDAFAPDDGLAPDELPAEASDPDARDGSAPEGEPAAAAQAAAVAAETAAASDPTSPLASGAVESDNAARLDPAANEPEAANEPQAANEPAPANVAAAANVPSVELREPVAPSHATTPPDDDRDDDDDVIRRDDTAGDGDDEDGDGR